jgi:acyl-CoA reductase-like NAD-dependent aldehyde dehydrogenase
MDTASARVKMEQAVDENNAAQFNQAYIAFLKQFKAFEQSYSTSPTALNATNAIFGQDSFYLKQTNDEQAQELLRNGRNASRMFASVPLQDRLEFMQLLNEKIQKHADAIALTITADTGKPIDLAKAEMTKGNEWFKFAAEEAEKQLGAQAKSPALLRGTKPLGVAQVIGAYNYPYALAVGGIVGALTAGNSVVVSAPLKAPNWVFPFIEAAQEAVQEFGQKASEQGKPWAEAFAKEAPHLVTYSMGVNRELTAKADVVHFVGSDVTGDLIRKSRGHKRTILEMGGTNVVTVMASATPKDEDAKAIANTIYGGFGPATGQRCTAPRILCVQDGAEGVVKHLEAFCEDGPKGAMGNPFKEGIKMGPLVDGNAHQKMMEAIALAKKLNAKVYGALPVSDNVIKQAGNSGSHWVNPIVIDWSGVDMSSTDNVKAVHDCLKNEIFGPLLHIVHPVKKVEDAIALTNELDTHGLAGAIFTQNQLDIEKYQDGTRITSLAVNGAPKDQSPRGEHGHPGLDAIGGDNHFNLYADRVVRAGGLVSAR